MYLLKNLKFNKDKLLIWAVFLFMTFIVLFALAIAFFMSFFTGVQEIENARGNQRYDAIPGMEVDGEN